MSKLSLVNRVPREYDAASIQEIVRQLETQENKHAEGSIAARHGALTASPTVGDGVRGDIVWNSTPSATGFIGWVCTVSGSPGTWVGFGGVGASAATQAEQETGSSTSNFVTPGRQQFHPSAQKGWIRFDGTGTVGIEASYNVTSLTDNGVGNYTVNWNVDFSSATGSSVVGSSGLSTARSFVDLAANGLQAAGSSNIITSDAAGVLADADIVCVHALGDQ